MRNALIVILYALILPVFSAAAKDVVVRGTVFDDTGDGLPGVVVTASGADSVMIGCVVTGVDGVFSFSVDSLVGRIVVEVGSLGYKTECRSVGLPLKKDLRFDLKPDVISLREVNVVAKPIRAQGDTLIYNVEAFKSNADRTIEDVVKRMPGITVDGNGSINYQGKPINNFYIEGLDMLQGNYTLATRNISADDIATVDVYENHQPMKVLENIELSDKAALNLTLKKKSLMRPVGRVSGGGGYGEKRGLWLGELTALMVSPSVQFLAVGKSTNMGAVYREEMKDHLDAVSTKWAVASNVFVEHVASTPAIARSRYDFNRSELASANAMKRFGEDANIAVNIAYDCDRGDMEAQDVMTLYRPGEKPLVVDNHVFSDLRARTAKADAALKINRRDFYLGDRLSFVGKFRDNVYAVRGTNELGEGLDADELRLSNSLSLALRRGNRVLQFYSSLLYVRVPRGGIVISPVSEGGDAFKQSASGAYFYNSERTSLSWIVGPHVTLGVDVMLNISKESFWSCLDRDIDEDGHRVGVNDLSFGDLSANLRPFFVWKKGGMTVRVDSRLSLSGLRVSDCVERTDDDYFKFYPGGEAKLVYRMGTDWTFSANCGYRATAGGLRNFVTAPIYTSYRTLNALGSGRLSSAGSVSAGGGVVYREVVRALFASVHATLSRSHYSTITLSDVSEDQTVIGYADAGSNNDNLDVRVEMSKRFRTINTTAKIMASWMASRSSTVRDGRTLVSDLSDLSVKASLDGSLLSGAIIGGFDCLYARSMQRVNMESLRNENDRVAASLRLSLFPCKSVEVYGKYSVQSLYYGSGSRVTQSFADAGVRYKRKRWEVELRFNNVTNQTSYYYTFFNGPDCINYNYRLRPFETCAVFRATF